MNQRGKIQFTLRKDYKGKGKEMAAKDLKAKWRFLFRVTENRSIFQKCPKKRGWRIVL